MNDYEVEISIPTHFLCPISLQLMKDPVIVSTGITYDRDNIEEWLFSRKNDTCPVSKQVLSDSDLTPNHTLRRLIQSWCILNASYGIERIPTPKSPVDKIKIEKLIQDAENAKTSPEIQLQCLTRLRSIALEGERNRSCLESAGAVDFLVSIVKQYCNVSSTCRSADLMCGELHQNTASQQLRPLQSKNATNQKAASQQFRPLQPENASNPKAASQQFRPLQSENQGILKVVSQQFRSLQSENQGILKAVSQQFKSLQSENASQTQHLNVLDEALSILHQLKISKRCFKNITNDNDFSFLESLVSILKYGSYQSRSYATMLLKNVYELADPIQLMSVKPEFFTQIVRILRDQISPQSAKSALKLLVEICPWGRNKVKAVEAGAVTVLIELLLENKLSDKRFCELTLTLLDQLCGCAEGRAELLGHGAGVAVVSKKILRVSHVVSDRGVRILGSICKFSGNPRVVMEMLEVGAVTKLCLVLQVDSCKKTKERVREILRMHCKVWRNSTCIPSHLLASFPSSS